MSNTPRLGAPELTAGQAVPETTVNEQARYAEQGAGFFIVIDKTLTAPPGSPAEGDAHIVAATATGAWAGKEKNIAFYMGGAWSFVTPIEGTHADCQADDTTYRYSGSAWAAVTATGALLIANNLSDLASASTARTNLGLGTAAVAASSSFLQVSSNLSDLANAGTARTNLGATTAGGNLLTIANPSAITFLRVNADNSVSALSASAFRTAIGAGTGTGSGDLVSTNNLSDVASAGTSRTNLGATTVGGNLFTLTNPSAITFPRFNADNSVSALSASAFRTAIGAGVGGGDLVSTNNLSDVASASTSRTNLGLAIGTNVQAWDADLDALAALSGTNTLYYRSASNTWTAVTIGGNLSFSGGTLNATQYYRVGFFFTTTPTVSEVIALHVASDAFTLPANFATPDSKGSCGTNPTASFALDVQKNGSSIGTITISTGGVFTFATASGTSKSIAAGDVIKVVAPSPVDATCANVAVTLKGTI